MKQIGLLLLILLVLSACSNDEEVEYRLNPTIQDDGCKDYISVRMNKPYFLKGQKVEIKISTICGSNYIVKFNGRELQKNQDGDYIYSMPISSAGSKIGTIALLDSIENAVCRTRLEFHVLPNLSIRSEFGAYMYRGIKNGLDHDFRRSVSDFRISFSGATAYTQAGKKYRYHVVPDSTAVSIRLELGRISIPWRNYNFEVIDLPEPKIRVQRDGSDLKFTCNIEINQNRIIPCDIIKLAGYEINQNSSVYHTITNTEISNVEGRFLVDSFECLCGEHQERFKVNLGL